MNFKNVISVVQTAIGLALFCCVNAALPPHVAKAQLSLCLGLRNVPSSAYVPRSRFSQRYKTLNYQWNTFNMIHPLAYIVPATTADVQSAIKCGRHLGIPMVAKSGGHSYEKYSFGDASSVIIDLGQMDSFSIDKGTGTAVIGPGILAAQLDHFAWQNGKYVTPAVVCLTVGHGGAAQGGGYGYLSKKFGLMSDNVLEMDMVDASGNLLKVNAQNNTDLFWALRGGGGGNFGIVTEFKIKVYAASKLRYKYAQLDYPPDQFGEVFDAFQKFCLDTVQKSVFVILATKTNGTTLTITDFNVSKKNFRRTIQKFPSPTKRSIFRISTYLDLAILGPTSSNVTKVDQLQNVTIRSTPRGYVKVKSYFASTLGSKEALAKLSSAMTKIPESSIFLALSFGGAINRIPKDATAFVHRNAFYTVEPKLGSNDSETVAWVNDLDEAMLELDNGESYQNIIDRALKYPEYLNRYYGSNLQRLQEIKATVDPDNYFKFPQSIPLRN